MRDLVYILVTLGFFGVAALFVSVCDRIVGPDPADGNGDRSSVPTAGPAERPVESSAR